MGQLSDAVVEKAAGHLLQVERVENVQQHRPEVLRRLVSDLETLRVQKAEGRQEEGEEKGTHDLQNLG